MVVVVVFVAGAAGVEVDDESEEDDELLDSFASPAFLASLPVDDEPDLA